MPLPNQPQPRQQLLSQNIQNTIASQPNLPPVSSLAPTPIQNVGQNSSLANNVNSGMQTSQHSAHMLQQSKVPLQQQSQQNASNLLTSQTQQPQPQAPQQQMMAQVQSQPAQLQQQLGLQQQTNPLQRDMQRLQASSSLLQQQSVLDQQKQLYQSQRPIPETSSTSVDSTAQTGQPSAGDWQEEVYQKIKIMKENYLPELTEMYQKIASKLQQHDLPNQPKSDQLEKLKVFKLMLERIIAFLQVSKGSILPNYKDKMSSYEKQIINFINTNRPRKAPGQLPPTHIHSMSQSQSQVTQVQSHENQMNSQLQTTNIQGSVPMTQQNNITSMQMSVVSPAQQNMINSMQPGTNLDSGQGNAINSLQQVPVSSLQQNPVSAPQQTLTHQQLKQGNQAASPQILQHSSPQVDQQNHPPSLTKAGTPLQSANSPFVGPTPSPPLAPSPMPGDSEKPIAGLSTMSNAGNVGHQQTSSTVAPAQSLAIGTPGISASPLLAEFSGPDGPHGNALAPTSGKSSVTDQPLERLIKVMKSMSSKALTAAVSDIGSVVSMNDRIAGSAPGNGSRAAVGEDLVAMTNCRLQARNFITQDGANGTRRMKRYTNATPLNVASSAGSMNDSIKQLTLEASDLESTATSSIKKPRIEANHALLEEIREINQRLIDTVVDISEEEVDPTSAAAAADGAEGTVVKCSFVAVALSPSLKSQYASAQMSPIQPLRLLVPTNYPNCSPLLLDKFPVESSKENEDLSLKAKARFSISLRSLSQPMSLGEIARTWDICARTVISEHAQQSGGGSFSSKYGTWEDCLTSA
ncbi:hypothetical protein Ahy_A09g046424 isoform E [Arachis hypogaea]|uniref:ARC105/Med15 mediator subunit C-terminal domain-containing protein n=1 Tax=Arachis hypogaea TaxID=3818 RepID=A0A445BPW5_ARAHY|nr:hypothetical protein Ahy_A09g046424 isoform E [Arachis hypogaea]